MKKIFIIEPSPNKDGHFYVYKKTLLEIPGTYECPMTIDFKKLKNYNAIKQLWIITTSFYKLIKQVPKGEVVHILYADIYYKIPFILNKLMKERRTILTVHSCPNGKLKRKLMKQFYKNAEIIIVHSEYIKNQFEALGLKNVELVHYPSFYDYSLIQPIEKLRIKYNIRKGDVVLGALGGLRKDKGIDILIESMKYISSNIKKRIILNIAGAPFDYSIDEIKCMCAEVNVRSNLILRFLSDEEFMECVVLSDIMVFPYRSTMTANSGPMTEAMVNRKPCIIPANTNLSAINEMYNVGVTFNQEDAASLGKTIENYIQHPTPLKYDIANELKLETFVLKHSYIYNKFINL